MSQDSRFHKIVGEAKSRVSEVSPQEAAERQRAGGQLIDVREADEFAKGHASGAVHVSKGVLALKIEQLVPNADTPIVCYCGGGSRSALAAESLQRMGYANVASMAGGFKAWQQAGLGIST
jgi:phage shock protein E